MNEANRMEEDLRLKFGARIWDLAVLHTAGARHLSGYLWQCGDGSRLHVNLVTGGTHPGGYIVSAID